jgi:arsenate reductase
MPRGGFALADVTIYHNPGCSKSRGALEILREHGIEPEIIDYLDAPLDRAALERCIELLAEPASELVRRDKRFRELGLDEAGYQSAADVIEVLLAHPELMQRPIVIRGSRAVIARPSDRVVELLEA